MTVSTAHGPPSRKRTPALALLFALWGCRNADPPSPLDASRDALSVDVVGDQPGVDARSDDLGGADVTSDRPSVDAPSGDGSIDATVDALVDDVTDAASDAAVEASLDAAPDVAVDAAADAVIDAAPDVAVDAAADAVVDAVVDAVADVTMGAVDAAPASDVMAGDAPADAGSRDAGAIAFDVGSLVDVPSLPDVNLEGLPRDDAGRIILGGSGEGTIALEPGDAGPIQVLARCSVLVTNCVSPGARTLDQCFASVRRCETATPWDEAPCCPSPCVTAYFAQRTAGAGPITSYDRALFGSPSCVAGAPDLGGL